MSVPNFCEVRLEIVRPGKQHNQLLSPLTPYMALCGEGSPITFHLDFEHHQLLTRLERLRYVVEEGVRFATVPGRMREAEVGELGNDIARILRNIDTLSTELARAQGNQPDGNTQTVVHLRIVLAGSELSLIPFEMAIAPLAYPGEGLEFCLQASLPIVVTREIRRGQPVPIRWGRASKDVPKILVVFAEPEGMRVPYKEHIQAIRNALEPWIRHVPDAKRDKQNEEKNYEMRLEFVKNRLRILPNASVQSIYKLCSEENFSHIHILAHGDVYKQAGETRFGVALCKDGTTQKEVVSGKRLAKVLQAEGSFGADRSQPLVVTLATCDSGNQTSVLVPGGSIAHDLHVEGIPWVFASQFPLTVSGSITMTKMLYPRLLRGDDPRQILFELRRQLFHSTQTDHDWASVVAYAAPRADFATRVAQFSSGQIKAAINVCLEHADSMANGAQPEKLHSIISQAKEWLHMWEGRKPTGNSPEERLRRSEIVGMHGSTYKRIALLLLKASGKEDDEVKKYYRKALEHYREAMGEAAATGMSYYWTATQYLSLQAILHTRKLVGGITPSPQIFELARSLAKRDLDAADNNSTRAWAHGTLAELELLSLFHQPDVPHADSGAEIANHCRKIVELMGPRSFHVGSTVRQFKRYNDAWGDDLWGALARKAVEILEPEPNVDYDWPEDYS